MTERITRRKLIAGTSLAIGAVVGLPMVSAAPGDARAEREDGHPARKLNVAVVGAHPDDPESSCGGIMALYSDLGCQVVAIYLTRGEAGIPGKTEAEAAGIRTAEAERACAILGVRPVFAGQIDGRTELTYARYEEFKRLIEAEKPDIVYAPWPIDSHRDHRAASLLTYDVWDRGGRPFDLYYTEVNLGEQTQNFQPTVYVDISTVLARKRKACYAHVSQNPPSFYEGFHERMQEFRGMECGCKAAEAFMPHVQNPPHTVRA